jgi:hypothetical protein
MGRPAFVFEDIHTTPRRPVFSLFGVPVYMTPFAWLNPLALYAGSIALTSVIYPEASLLGRLGWASIYALLGLATLFIHSIGHILSGKIAGSAMDSLLLTATRQVNIYEGDQSQYPPRVHITRALGGPAGNLLAGLVGLLLIAVLSANPPLVFWAVANLAGGIGALAPVDSVDGGTIMYHLRARGEGSRA